MRIFKTTGGDQETQIWRGQKRQKKKKEEEEEEGGGENTVPTFVCVSTAASYRHRNKYLMTQRKTCQVLPNVA